MWGEWKSVESKFDLNFYFLPHAQESLETGEKDSEMKDNNKEIVFFRYNRKVAHELRVIVIVCKRPQFRQNPQNRL